MDKRVDQVKITIWEEGGGWEGCVGVVEAGKGEDVVQAECPWGLLGLESESTVVGGSEWAREHRGRPTCEEGEDGGGDPGSFVAGLSSLEAW